MKDKKKTIILVIGIILMGLLVVGGTYAYLIKALDVTNGNYNISSACFDINYDTINEDGTSDITGTLIPSATAQGGLSGKVSLSIDSSCDVYASGKIFLNVGNVDNTLIQPVGGHCENFKTLKTLTEYTNETSCETSKNGMWVTDGTALKYAVYSNINNDPINVGYVKETGSINIYSNFNVSSTQKDYHIYIWVDGNLINNTYTSTTFSGNISAQVIQRLDPLPEKPTLDDGMIPVVISADGVVKTISKNDEKWYDYSNKEWANVVLVDDESRGSYRGRTGVTVAQDDILAYYVWIPRYKYKIWTTGLSSAGEEQSIEILFEDRENTMRLGTTIGSYRSHPAFWWDDDNDSVVDTGELLAGIWVGKFETSADSESDCYKNILYGVECNSVQSPRVLPSVIALSYQSVINQFSTSQKFTEEGNIFGLNSNAADGHMMKNGEWGVVTYLSHSKYGINQDVYMNNAGTTELYYTGRSGGATYNNIETLAEHYSGQTSSSVATLYGYYTWLGQEIDVNGNIGNFASDRTLGTYASTTGNVTGIYDMAGGIWERIMANYNNLPGASGFTTMPEKKYYDVYLEQHFVGNYENNISYCKLDTCGGSALYETYNWYSSLAYLVDSTYYWLSRGGNASQIPSTDKILANIFAVSIPPGDSGGGNASLSLGFRTAIVVK